MDARRVFTFGLVLAGLAAAVYLVSCSSSGGGSPTSPGGGGGTVSFSFTFPSVGSSSSQVFATAGSYAYRCNTHQGSGMTGTVVVNAGSAVDSAIVNVGSGSSNVFDPSSVTIKPGGLVRWVRPAGVSAANHSAVR